MYKQFEQTVNYSKLTLMFCFNETTNTNGIKYHHFLNLPTPLISLSI